MADALARASIVLQQKDPNEIAVNTLHFRVPPGTGGAWTDPQLLADAIKPLFEAWWSGIAGRLAGGTKAQRIDCYTLDPVTLDAIGKGTVAWDGGLPGGAGGALPPQVAWALTLYGYPPSGWAEHRARKRGRIFLGPLSTGILDASGTGNLGRPSSQAVTDIMGPSITFFSAMRNLAMSDGNHARVGVLSVRDKVCTDIVALGLDDVLDTQRRRVNRLTATRTFGELT